MKDNITVLYLQGFTFNKKYPKQKLFEETLGKENVIASDCDMKSDIIILYTFFGFILFVCLFNLYVATRFLDIYIIFITMLNCVVMGVTIYCVGCRLMCYYIIQKSLKQVDQLISTYNPDIIVGVHFGAIIAMNLKYPKKKKPLIILSPSVHIHKKIDEHIKLHISSFPYVLLIHTSKDQPKVISFCTNLMKSIPSGKGRLEIVDGNTSYSQLKEEDIKKWVEEVMYNINSSEDTVFNNIEKEKGKERGRRKIQFQSYSLEQSEKIST